MNVASSLILKNYEISADTFLQNQFLHTSNYVLYYAVFKVSEYICFISLNIQKYFFNIGSNRKQRKIICQMEKHNLWGVSNKQCYAI